MKGLGTITQIGKRKLFRISNCTPSNIFTQVHKILCSNTLIQYFCSYIFGCIYIHIYPNIYILIYIRILGIIFSIFIWVDISLLFSSSITNYFRCYLYLCLCHETAKNANHYYVFKYKRGSDLYHTLKNVLMFDLHCYCVQTISKTMKLTCYKKYNLVSVVKGSILFLQTLQWL